MSRAKLSPEAKSWRASEKRVKTQRERLAMQQQQREMSAAKKAAGLTYHAGQRETEAERGWRQQLPLMPDDTRDLTGRTFGDPLTGRSALDMRRA